MTKVAVWCRHEGDNIIGIGQNIPWNVPSDFKKFARIVSGHNIVVGRPTYETLPPKFDKEKIFVLTSNPEYEVKNPKLHQVITNLKMFKDFAEDLYISGGAGVYQQFMEGGSKLMPEVIVDCIYHGELQQIEGKPVDISPCIEIMHKKYFQVGTEYEEDNVTTRIFIRKGEFVDQSVLKNIIECIIHH